jgi:hypothetical protein
MSMIRNVNKPVRIHFHFGHHALSQPGAPVLVDLPLRGSAMSNGRMITWQIPANEQLRLRA